MTPRKKAIDKMGFLLGIIVGALAIYEPIIAIVIGVLMLVFWIVRQKSKYGRYG